MDNETTIYSDPNAYIMREKPQAKPKIDLNHIEKVFYPQPYENIPQHYNQNEFKNPNPPTPSTQQQGFDISKLLPLLTGKGNISSLMPNLLGNLGLNQDMMQLFKNFLPTKTAKSKGADTNFSSDSISRYEKV